MHTVKRYEQVYEVHFSQKQSNGRHDDIFYQGVDDIAKRCTYYDTNRHVQNTAFHGELLELSY